jgi:ferredoxin
MLMLMEDIVEGRATMETIDTLEALAVAIQKGSLCALGKTAPNPVLSVLKHFREEMIEHVVDKKCRAGVCKKLMQYVIDPEKCIGCGKCQKGCPAEAISRTDYIAPGHKLASMVIDATKCIKCGACIGNCKFGAISVK